MRSLEKFKKSLDHLAEKRDVDIGGEARVHAVHDEALLEPHDVGRKIYHHHHHLHHHQEHEENIACLTLSQEKSRDHHYYHHHHQNYVENITCLSHEKSRDKSMAQPIAIVQKRLSRMWACKVFL